MFLKLRHKFGNADELPEVVFATDKDSKHFSQRDRFNQADLPERRRRNGEINWNQAYKPTTADKETTGMHTQCFSTPKLSTIPLQSSLAVLNWTTDMLSIGNPIFSRTISRFGEFS
jgi:hypothetical protein